MNEEERKEIKQKWIELEKMALNNNPLLEIPKIPYSDTHIVGQNNGLFNGNILYIIPHTPIMNDIINIKLNTNLIISDLLIIYPN
mgnify:CR=1 FL=1